ncbi:4-oxalocrotonate tautomerase [Breoghania sp.]|uniref:tautomerase family protein n=1 Tax=Breoghania sp. TaxID=2065378 RepID=UPI002AAB7202|nr:4-oxalocrotonate tautomerase [Breoghania sp.]
MPLLDVAIASDKIALPCNRIAKILTELTAQHLHKDPMRTAVTIRRIATQDWFIGAAALSQEQGSFSLRIAVSEGTNSPDEMAAYIDAVFAAMNTLAGPVHEVSYVIVEEVPFKQWGFGGLTQFARSAGRAA